MILAIIILIVFAHFSDKRTASLESKTLPDSETISRRSDCENRVVRLFEINRTTPQNEENNYVLSIFIDNSITKDLTLLLKKSTDIIECYDMDETEKTIYLVAIIIDSPDDLSSNLISNVTEVFPDDQRNQIETGISNVKQDFKREIEYNQTHWRPLWQRRPLSRMLRINDSDAIGILLFEDDEQLINYENYLFFLAKLFYEREFGQGANGYVANFTKAIFPDWNEFTPNIKAVIDLEMLALITGGTFQDARIMSLREADLQKKRSLAKYLCALDREKLSAAVDQLP